MKNGELRKATGRRDLREAPEQPLELVRLPKQERSGKKLGNTERYDCLARPESNQTSQFSPLTSQLRWVCLLVFITLALASCYRSNDAPTHPSSSTHHLSPLSLQSPLTHYTRNYNFVVTADSIPLIVQSPVELLSGLAVDSDIVVVAEIQAFAADTIDSVWVQVARDAQTIGWLRERSLLPAVSPDNPISIFIDRFSDTHLLVVLGVVVVLLGVWLIRRLSRRKAMMVHFNDINSFYPTLLALLVSSAAVFYSTIQLADPESWRHFYFYPTLNPFSVPLHLSLFLFAVWFIIIVGVAAVYDVWRQLPTGPMLFYLLGLAGICAVDYVVFSISTIYYIGYPLLLVYVCFAVWRYIRHARAPYVCGHCGAPLLSKGVCPRCGVFNE